MGVLNAGELMAGGLGEILGRQATLGKIKRAMAAAAISNPDTAPLATGVTVTVATADDTTLTILKTARQMIEGGFIGATGGQIYYSTAGGTNGRAAIFSQNREGEIGNFGATGFPFATTVPVPPALASDATKTGVNALGPMRLYFYTEAPKILFRLAAAAAGASVRMLVDGRYVDKAGYDVSGAVNNYLLADFGGVRTGRTVCLEIQGLVILFSMRIDALSRWTDPTPADPVLVLHHADSHGQAGTNNAPYWDSASRIAADKIGAYEMQVAAVASTGWVMRGSTGNFFTIGEAMQRTITRRPWSMIIMGGGYNDTAQAPAAVTAAVLAAARAARAANPNALIVILGVEGGATGPSAAIISMEQAKKAAFDQFADAFSVFIPISTAAEPWEYGTGRVGATNGSGNSDLYFGPDNAPPHKNLAGERYFADRLNLALRQAVATLQ